MKILFIGDIVAKIGRRAVAKVLPGWKEEYEPDLVIANGENMAHGSGFTPDTFEEVRKSGVDFMTAGNHWARKAEGLTLFEDKSFPLVRPANWAGQVPGEGWRVIEVGTTKVAIINLIGQSFMTDSHDNPFHEFDRILKKIPENVKIKIVDFHGEATSEKQAFGWHADGRASLVVGTHTHVPTADTRILLAGTAFVTDLGMCGLRDGVIGDDRSARVRQFLDQLPVKTTLPDTGPAVVNAVLCEIENATGKAKSIKRLDAEVEI